jgi:hypothetical protein
MLVFLRLLVQLVPVQFYQYVGATMSVAPISAGVNGNGIAAK